MPGRKERAHALAHAASGEVLTWQMSAAGARTPFAQMPGVLMPMTGPDHRSVATNAAPGGIVGPSGCGQGEAGGICASFISALSMRGGRHGHQAGGACYRHG